MQADTQAALNSPAVQGDLASNGGGDDSLQGSGGPHLCPQKWAVALTARPSKNIIHAFCGRCHPADLPGLVVGLADRLILLAGLFAGAWRPPPKGPRCIRASAAAIGLVQNLMTKEISLNLRACLEDASALLPVASPPESQQACLDFIVNRLENLLLEEGARFDVVKAVLAETGHDPCLAAQNASELAVWVARQDWHTILPAFARCVRITRDLKQSFKVDEKNFTNPHEKNLYQAYQKTASACQGSRNIRDFLTAFVEMVPIIDQFFDSVLVMDEDPSLRSTAKVCCNP